MRFIYPLIVMIAGSIAISAFTTGRWTEGTVAAAIALVVAILFWRNLRDPEVTRRHGHQATIQLQPARGNGTAVQIITHNGTWDAVLDRAPRAEDITATGDTYRGWVWLDETGLPQRLRIRYGPHWESFDVLSADPAP